MKSNRNYLIPSLSSLIGGSIGFVTFLLIQRGFLPISLSQGVLFSVIGAILGLIIGLSYIPAKNLVKKLYLAEITLSVPEFSQMTFKINEEYRLVAWKLFVETISRIATQPLDPEAGFLREALDSLHNLFLTTRELVKNMKPSSESKGTTIELFAITMLNDVLRPFLSKWHPLLSEFEESSSNNNEANWEFNTEFRKELELLRKDLLSYAQAYGEIAQIEQLEKYFDKTT